MKNTQVATMQPKEETIRLYTYEDAISIYKRKQVKRIAQKLYSLEQKIYGFGITVIGLLSVLILKDGTFACFAIPFGLWAMATKKNLLSD